LPRKISALQLYKQFEDTTETGFSGRAWTIAIFEGSPSEGLYSWCPDCIVASAHIERFEKYQSDMNLLKFKVGTRKEWESKQVLNPFKTKYPYLSDVPTAILFLNKLDVFRVVAPREKDLTLMCERTKIYEEQISSNEWHPPINR
jgi:hypothetical protein